MSRPGRLSLAATVAILVAAIVAGSLEAAPNDGGRRQNPRALAQDFDVVTLADGFEQPSGIDWLPDRTLLVTEKSGLLWAVETDGDRRLLLDISDHVSTQRERGLNGVAVDSNFSSTRRVYLLYAFKVNAGGGRQAMRLTYITLDSDGDVVNPAAPETVLLGKDAVPGKGCPPASKKRDCPPSIGPTHQGGTILSAEDGTLWLGFGDSNLPVNLGRHVFRTFDPDSTAGKILHIDSEGNGLPGHPYCKGTDNLTRTCTKVFAVGFRNPFRFTLRPSGTPIVGDVGWNLREEIDLVRPGMNYGWPCYEGDLKTPFYREQGRCKALYRKGKSADLAKPAYDYANPPGTGAAGAAVIVGPHYGGGPYPDSFDGGYFFGDYAKAFIKLIKIKKGKARTTSLIGGIAPVELKLDADGNLAFVDFITGAVRKLVYSPGNKAPTAKIFASPSSGPGPSMTVNFSALDSSDPDGNPLSYDWDFGDGSPHESGASTTHTYTSNGTYTVRLTVNDGTATGQAQTKIIVGNTVPTATLISPATGTRSRAGLPVTLRATGTDPEDGTLPPSAFSWNVVLVHKQHQHPLGTLTGNTTQFEAVTDHDADSQYMVSLTVTDSGGLSTELGPVEVAPETTRLKIGSRPKGVKLEYGGREVKAPKKIAAAAIGFRASLSAPAEVRIDGDTYNFAGWSQGRRRVQIYTIPAAPSKIIARYKRSK